MYGRFSNIYKTISQRLYSNSSSSHALEHLKERSLIRVTGQEVSEFLQGLMTNDIRHLENGAGSMFTMFLNTKGRILYEAIIYSPNENNTYLIECDKNAVELLQKHLKIYKVKRKIEIDNLQDEYKVYVLFNEHNWIVTNQKKTNSIEEGMTVPCDKLLATLPTAPTKMYKDLLIYKDPRVVLLGSRIIAKADVDVKAQINNLVKIADSNISYRFLRYSLGVGEGVIDLPPGNSFPLECNCDYLHGVSFHKGCYIGQELTARTYHTGVIRKRLMPLYFNKIPTHLPEDQTIVHEKTNLGKLRGVEGNVGLALLRINKAMQFDEINIGNESAKVIKPLWWPLEASKEKMTVQKS